jgi:Calcineurin-like phosphoesterase
VISTIPFSHRSLLTVKLLFSVLISGFSLYSVVYLDQPIWALEDFNFAAVGDWGCNSDTDATVNNIKSKNPELVLALGDFSYKSTGTCWFKMISPIDNITRITFGDHDLEGFNGYMSHFGLSQTYYSFDHENTHILVLDTVGTGFLHWLPSLSPQYNFAVNDLRSASQDPDIDWIIVYFHMPFYTSPTPCCKIFSSGLRDMLHPLFDEYEVDLVLAGDIHSYQRTFPLRYNVNSPASPIITSTNASDYTDPKGEIYAVVGTGGFSLHKFSDKASFVSSQQDDFYGQLDIKITDNGNRMEGKFYRNGNNAILDSFSITK